MIEKDKERKFEKKRRRMMIVRDIPCSKPMKSQKLFHFIFIYFPQLQTTLIYISFVHVFYFRFFSFTNMLVLLLPCMYINLYLQFPMRVGILQVGLRRLSHASHKSQDSYTMLVYTLQYVHIKYLDGLVNKQNNKFLSSHYTVLHPGFASYTTLVVFVRFLR